MYYRTMISVAIILCCNVFLHGCGGKKEIAGNYTYRTECLGSELDGSVTVKTWGNGRNRADAVEQAQKNAVYDVLFKGITEGKSDCFPRPLVTEPNARLKHESYFNRFFRDGGDFRQFVSTEDERFGDRFGRNAKDSRHGYTYGIVVRVLRADLKEKMINEGIVKQ
jgi:hypothetical protein